MESENHKIVIGVIGHIDPIFLPDFKRLLEELSYFRLVRFQESDNKLWIVERGGHDE